MVMSWYWDLLNCKAALSSPKGQCEREDPQPDSFAAVVWSDCSGSSRKKASDDRTRSVSYFDMRILVDSLSGNFKAMWLSALKAQRSLSSIKEQDTVAAAPPAAGSATGEEQQQAQHEEQQQEHHPVLQELVVCTHLDNDDEAAARVAAPMVDNDNKPAPENCHSCK